METKRKSVGLRETFVTVRLSSEEQVAARVVAERLGVGVSTWVRMLVLERLRGEGVVEPPPPSSRVLRKEG